MAYDLKLSNLAQDSIRGLVAKYGDGTPDGLINAIETKLEVLGEDRKVGQRPDGAFGRPIYRFSVTSEHNGDPLTLYLQAAYSVEDEAQDVVVLDVGVVRF